MSGIFYILSGKCQGYVRDIFSCNLVATLYTGATAAVQIKSFTTNWFEIKTGIRQGDSLSPTLFAIFINDLAIEVKEKHAGIKIDENLSVPILLYADNIILLAKSESELQKMLNTVYNWCSKWRLKVNSTKTKIMHFRNVKKPMFLNMVPKHSK